MSIIHRLYKTYIISNKKNTLFIDFLNNPKNSTLINGTDNDLRTVLHHAAYSGEYEVIYQLLERNVDINKKDKFKRTALNYCLESGSEIFIPVVRLLIARGANIHEADDRGFTALHNAVLAGNLIKVKQLLALGADINKINQNMQTPLTLALKRNIPNKDQMLQLLFKESVIISQDFSDTQIPQGITDGVVMIGSTVWSDDLLQEIPVDRTMKGFENAITNIQEFEAAAKADAQEFAIMSKNSVIAKRKYHYKSLEFATQHKEDPAIKAFHALILRLIGNEGLNEPMLKRAIAQNLAKLCLFSKNAERISLESKISVLPSDVRSLIDEEITNIIIEKSVSKK